MKSLFGIIAGLAFCSSAGAQEKLVIGNTSAMAPGPVAVSQSYDVVCKTVRYRLLLEKSPRRLLYSSESVKDVDLSESPLAALLLDSSLFGNLHFACSFHGLGINFFGFRKNTEASTDPVDYYGHVSNEGAPTVERGLRVVPIQRLH